jgi:hypothetical protein
VNFLQAEVEAKRELLGLFCDHAAPNVLPIDHMHPRVLVEGFKSIANNAYHYFGVSAVAITLKRGASELLGINARCDRLCEGCLEIGAMT